MQITTKRSVVLLSLLAVAGATVPARAVETQVVSTFEGNKGPGWKSGANVMGAVGPRHVVDFTMGGFTVHDEATGKTLRHLSQREFWKHVEPGNGGRILGARDEATARRADIEQSKATGFVEHIVKPISSVKALMEAVTRVVRGSS